MGTINLRTMKKVFSIILIGYLAGIAGAYTLLKINAFQNNEASTNDHAAESEFLVNNRNKELKEDFTMSHAVLPTEGKADLADLNESFAYASESSTSSVVYIKNITEKVYSNTWYEWFFGEGNVSQTFISSGSGVIFTEDGYIVTNNHVVEKADKIEVIHQKRTYEAKVIGLDPSTDLAVLKIEAQGLPNIRLGSSHNLRVGEWVLAVGNPFNLTSTVTAGIVSAKGRQINILRSNFPIESFIQTDAAINPGNSGGALVNVKGELVGINTAILSRTGSYAGYGFAVPVDMVAKIVNDLIKYGEVQKAFVGADVTDINEKLGEKLDLKDLRGVYVENIMNDGAASKGGIEVGDIIVGINGSTISSKGDFEEVISYHSPGDEISVNYLRNKNSKTTKITLTNIEGTTTVIKREIFTSRELGADFEIIPKVERELLKIEHGVRIMKIRNGFIKRLGIEEGFVVTNINKIPIKDVDTLVDILIKIRGRVYIEGVNKEGVRGYYSYFF